MKARRLCDALLILCVISADAFGQTGNVPLRASPSSSGPGRAEAAAQVPDRSSRPQPVERTAQDVNKSHPDSIQVQLGLLADSLSEAGLTEESRQLQALQRRIGDEHYERLSTAHKRAQARVPQIKLHVQWVEYLNTSEVSLLLRVLHEIPLHATQLPKRSPALKTNGGGMPTTRISAFIDELVKRGLGTVVTDPPITLLSGETTEFEQGQEMDVSVTDEGNNRVLTFTKSDSPTKTDSGKNTQWVGTFVKTTVTVAKDNMINFSFAMDHADIGCSPIPRRIEGEDEISEGHSLRLAGVPTYQSVTEVMRLPTDGIPLDGTPIMKRFLPFKTGRQEKQQDLSVVSPAAVRKKHVLIVITPEIIRPLEAHKPVSIPGIPAVRTRPATIKTTASPVDRDKPYQR